MYNSNSYILKNTVGEVEFFISSILLQSYTTSTDLEMDNASETTFFLPDNIIIITCSMPSGSNIQLFHSTPITIYI